MKKFTNKTAAIIVAVMSLVLAFSFIGCGSPSIGVKAILIKTAPTVASVYGEDFKIANDGVLRVKYEDDSVADVAVTADMIDTQGFDKFTTESQTLKITYGGKSVTFDFVLLRLATSITITKEPTVLSFTEMPLEIDSDGVLSVNYKDGASAEVTITEDILDLSNFDIESELTQTVPVNFGGLTTSFDVTLEVDTLDNSGELMTFRFETEEAEYGGYAAIEDCGGELADPVGSYMYREDGSYEQCIKNLFLGEGGYIRFNITCNKRTNATLKLSIGTQGFDTFPNFDDYARITLRGKKIESGIVYDPTIQSAGQAPWWMFQIYTVTTELTLVRGNNVIEIATYGYAGIDLDANDFSDKAGGRNINWIELETTGTLEIIKPTAA